MIKLRTAVIVIGVVISGFYYGGYPSFAHGGMGGMGHGMMGMPDGSQEKSPIAVNSSHAKKLLSYIQNEHLQCMQCHAVSKVTVGPSFSSVSANYAHKKDAIQILGNHIAHGFGRMPPGLANDQQAHDLSKLILSLAEESIKSENN
jgi:cytochrome c551/c552